MRRAPIYQLSRGLHKLKLTLDNSDVDNNGDDDTWVHSHPVLRRMDSLTSPPHNTKKKA